MAEQQHSPRRRASIRRMRDQVDLTDRPSIIDESAKAPRCLYCGSAHRRSTCPAFPSPPPAVPQRRVALWFLVILVVGVVMADLATMKDWVMGRFLEPPPLPPIPAAYDYNAVLNETLRQREESLAMDIATPYTGGLKGLGLKGLFKQYIRLRFSLQDVTAEYSNLWGPAEARNQTADRFYDQLDATRKYVWELLGEVVGMDMEMGWAITEASERVNSTASDLSLVLNMPSNEVVEIWGPQPRRSNPIPGLRTVPDDDDGDDITPDPQLIRDRILWKIVCNCQAFIISISKGLLKKPLQAREMINATKREFKPVEEFMRKELVIRKDMARVIIDNIHQRYNTSMQEWGASLPNRLYRSPSALMGVLGWYLDGQDPPTWPFFDLLPHRLNMDRLERVEAGVIFFQAMMRSIEAHLADSRILIGYTATRPADVDANHPCPLRLANADNSTQPQSPHEMLLILEKHVAAFAIQIHSWDEELFHNHVQQAWERREGDLHQGGQSSVLLGARDWLHDLASIARLLI
ncbi:Lactam utilization protein lamb [Lasiodiplodia theobromae]|uniref:Lactam utilization protein lamb n=1 Tax=Lasiodiplodia theobromae TaxID=45133 RepID=UPI0015C34514|nr:Lactam utilization protein lamb [Lasiodiplodia theobromae]KAF4537874.1 Lactam utilization protein lamb [Lasiodiplodia theobromae]